MGVNHAIFRPLMRDSYAFFVELTYSFEPIIYARDKYFFVDVNTASPKRSVHVVMDAQSLFGNRDILCDIDTSVIITIKETIIVKLSQ